MGGACASSSKQQQAISPTGPKAGSRPKENCHFLLGPRTLPYGDQASLGPAMPLSHPQWASARTNRRAQGGPKVGPPQAYTGSKSPKTGSGGSKTDAGGVHCPCSWAESSLAMFGLPLSRFGGNFLPPNGVCWPKLGWIVSRGPKPKIDRILG